MAAMHSSAGKTAATCALISALRRQGVPVQPFKSGPDFIDPAYHRHFAGVPSRNLDLWMMKETGIDAEVARVLPGKLGLIEASMGLFDGSTADSDEGSALALARYLDWPVVLVVSARGVGRSVYAAIQGFISEAGPGRIAGLVLNEVGGTGHAEYLRSALARLDVPIVGVLMKAESLAWPERHLGLQASQEQALPGWEELADEVGGQYDLEALLELATPAPESREERVSRNRSSPKKRIAIARDEAFHFYYESNLEGLEEWGAELVPFSPLHSEALPPAIDGVIFGGGFPEMYARGLAANQALQRDVRRAVSDGLPCYAECGGLIFLAERLRMKNGEMLNLTGLLPGMVEMTGRLQDFGYCSAKLDCESDGPGYPGHEFHYSRWTEESSCANLWEVKKKRTGKTRREGFSGPNMHASYIHLHRATAEPLFRKIFNLYGTA